MSGEDFGFWLVIGAAALCLFVAWLLVHVYRIEWFRHRLLSKDRWTRTRGMLPIAVPVYLLIGTIAEALRT